MEPVSDSTSGEDLGSLLESTLTLSRGLETLYSEHKVLLEALGEDSESPKKTERDLEGSHGKVERKPAHAASRANSPGPQSSDETVESEEFVEQVRVEKTAALGHSLELLKTGIDEAKVCCPSLVVQCTCTL